MNLHKIKLWTWCVIYKQINILFHCLHNRFTASDILRDTTRYYLDYYFSEKKKSSKNWIFWDHRGPQESSCGFRFVSTRKTGREMPNTSRADIIPQITKTTIARLTALFWGRIVLTDTKLHKHKTLCMCVLPKEMNNYPLRSRLIFSLIIYSCELLSRNNWFLFSSSEVNNEVYKCTVLLHSRCLAISCTDKHLWTQIPILCIWLYSVLEHLNVNQKLSPLSCNVHILFYFIQAFQGKKGWGKHIIHTIITSLSYSKMLSIILPSTNSALLNSTVTFQESTQKLLATCAIENVD